MIIKPTAKWHCPECESTFGEYVRAFIESFGTGNNLVMPLTGFFGRVLRGIGEDDFVTLTNNPER